MPRLGLKKLRDLTCYRDASGRWRMVWAAVFAANIGAISWRRVIKAKRKGEELSSRTPAAKPKRAFPPVTCYPNDVGNYGGKRRASAPTTARRVYSSPSDIDGFGAMAAIAMMAAKMGRRGGRRTV